MIRGCAPTARYQSAEAIDRVSVAVLYTGRQNPGPAAKEIGTGGPDPRGRRPGERMAADESQSLGQMTSGFDDCPFGAADVGHDGVAAETARQLAQNTDVLTDRSRQHDEVRGRCQRQLGPSLISRTEALGGGDGLRPVDRDNPAGRPRFPQRERDRASDQSAADDGDLVKHAMLNVEC